MPLEYIADVPEPFVLMYSSIPMHWQSFHGAILDLLRGKGSQFKVHELPGWGSLGGCQLIAKLDKRDRGLRRIAELQFECVLTRIWWDNNEGMIEGFSQIKDWKLHAHQYLHVPGGDLEWVLSTNFEW